jgi:general secretion pathway protein M
MNPITPFMQALSVFWRQRSPQEQRTLRLALIALIVLLAYQLIWSPVQQAAKIASERLATAQKLAVFTAQAKETLSHQRPSSGENQAQLPSLMVWVEQAARATGIEQQLSQRQPLGGAAAGQERVQLKFSAVPFESLLRWLAQANAAGIRVSQLDITPPQGAKTGLVDANIQLGRQVRS